MLLLQPVAFSTCKLILYVAAVLYFMVTGEFVVVTIESVSKFQCHLAIFPIEAVEESVKVMLLLTQAGEENPNFATGGGASVKGFVTIAGQPMSFIEVSFTL